MPKQNNEKKVMKLPENSLMKHQIWLKIWQYMTTKKIEPNYILELLQIISAIAGLATLSLPVGVAASIIALFCLIDRSKDQKF
ncbi:MAG TPA: hypothetical protein DEP38_04855 [Cyanobacteria bacterium UBA9226]|nr:hypothetical protein [Cyanobacteria bacterium UBA9226]